MTYTKIARYVQEALKAPLVGIATNIHTRQIIHMSAYPVGGFIRTHITVNQYNNIYLYARKSFSDLTNKSSFIKDFNYYRSRYPYFVVLLKKDSGGALIYKLEGSPDDQFPVYNVSTT